VRPKLAQSARSACLSLGTRSLGGVITDYSPHTGRLDEALVALGAGIDFLMNL